MKSKYDNMTEQEQINAIRDVEYNSADIVKRITNPSEAVQFATVERWLYNIIEFEKPSVNVLVFAYAKLTKKRERESPEWTYVKKTLDDTERIIKEKLKEALKRSKTA